MYYTGVDPRNMQPVYIVSNPHEKAMQRALLQYRKPENYALVKEALLKAGRQELIGFDRHCLIPPRPIDHTKGKNISGKTNSGHNGSGRKTGGHTGNGRKYSEKQGNGRKVPNHAGNGKNTKKSK